MFICLKVGEIFEWYIWNVGYKFSMLLGFWLFFCVVSFCFRCIIVKFVNDCVFFCLLILVLNDVIGVKFMEWKVKEGECEKCSGVGGKIIIEWMCVLD